jgi:hypothetical protein
VNACTWQLTLHEVSITGESIDQEVNSFIENLNSNPAFFRINRLGQLDPNTVSFVDSDPSWSRNVKRGILSTLQTLSTNQLNEFETERSALVYETDVLGRCRTTYRLNKYDKNFNVYVPGYESFVLQKTKELHTCTLANNGHSNDFQFIAYKSIPVSCIRIFI